MDCFNIQDESNLKLNSSLFSLIKLPRIKTSILLSFSMLISWRPFSSDCGMLLHLTQNSRKKLSGNQSGYISDGFMRKSAHKCANLTKTLRLQISCIFSFFWLQVCWMRILCDCLCPCQANQSDCKDGFHGDFCAKQ